MERNISRTAYALIGILSKALLIVFAALFAMGAVCMLVGTFTGDGVIALAGAVASAFIAWLCWQLQKETPVKMEGR